MKFKTTCNGEIEYSEKDVLTFKKGIPGFTDLHNFVIVDIEDNYHQSNKKGFYKIYFLFKLS